MKLTVNGEPYERDRQPSVLELLRELGAKPERTAVMVNGTVIASDRRASAKLEDGDEVELLVFAGGG